MIKLIPKSARVRISVGVLPLLLACMWLLSTPRTAAQCEKAPDGTVMILLMDMKSPDIPPDRLHRFLDILTFKLNSGIRNDLNGRNLLGGRKFTVRWCSGTQVSDQNTAAQVGSDKGAAGVMWGFIDQSSGQIKSATNMTNVRDDPNFPTDLTNIVFGQEKELVNNAYLAFASYIIGWYHFEKGDVALARRCFNYAKELKALPSQLASSLNNRMKTLDEGTSVGKLTPVGRGGK